MKEIFATTQVVNDQFDALLEKFGFWKVVRICAWITRFTKNARKPLGERSQGPLSTEEIEARITWWLKRTQESLQGSDKFQKDQLQLNLQPNEKGLLECRGRVQGHYPTFLPHDHLFTSKLVMDAHLKTLHGGIGMTMTNVRTRYWVP